MRWHQLLGPLLLMVLAISAAYYQNAHAFHLNDSRDAFIFDGGHYYESCRQLVIALMRPQGIPVLSARDLGTYLLLDGPAFPLLVALPYLFAHAVPSMQSWQNLIILECVLHGFATVCVFALSGYVTRNLAARYLAALVWALYPGALTASQRFLTEVPALVLLLVYVLALASAFRGRFHLKSLLSGLIAGSILMMRAALFPLALLLALLAFLMHLPRSGIKHVTLASLCFALGLALIILSWAFYTKESLGTAYICPQRVPAHNLFIGWDFPMDGFGSFPPRSEDYFARSPSMAWALVKLWIAHPLESTMLGLRKVLRLNALPWNDFRSKALGVPMALQVLWHQLIVLSALGGALLLAFRPVALGRKGAAGLFVILSCLVVWLGHFIYLCFEAMPRYGFTQMPFLILLAMYFFLYFTRAQLSWVTVKALAPPVVLILCLADTDFFQRLLAPLGGVWLACLYGLSVFGVWIWWGTRLSRLLQLPLPRRPGSQVASASLALVVTLLGSAFLCEGIASPSRGEWSSRLKPEERAVREIEGKIDADRALLIVDTDRHADDLQIAVNGKSVDGPLRSIYAFDQGHHFLAEVLDLFDALLKRPPGDFRQWRAVELPVAYLLPQGPNEIALSAKSGSATIYGDYKNQENEVELPTWTYVVPGKIFSTFTGLEFRPYSTVRLASSASRSYRQMNGQLSGKQTGSYRVYLLLLKAKAGKQLLQADPGKSVVSVF